MVEDADVQAMLTHHTPEDSYPIHFTTAGGTYDVKAIQRGPARQRKYLLACYGFTGCDTVSAIMGHGKSTLFDKPCSGAVDEYLILDVFMDTEATKDDVIRAGICLFKYIYNAPGASLAQ